MPTGSSDSAVTDYQAVSGSAHTRKTQGACFHASLRDSVLSTFRSYEVRASWRWALEIRLSVKFVHHISSHGPEWFTDTKLQKEIYIWYQLASFFPRATKNRPESYHTPWKMHYPIWGTPMHNPIDRHSKSTTKKPERLTRNARELAWMLRNIAQESDSMGSRTLVIII